MTAKKPGASREKFRRKLSAKNETPVKEEAEATPAGDESGWRRFLSSKNWLVVVLVTAIVGVAIPAAFPATIDAVRDVWSDNPVTIEPADASDVVVGVPILATSGAMPATTEIGEIADLAQQAGGQPAGVSGQRLTLQNHRASTILVTDIRPVVEKRSKPLDGTLVKFLSQGNSTTTVLDLDLDSPQPLPTGRHESGQSTGEPFFVGRNIVLDAGETHLVHLRTVTRRCDCSWRLQVTYRYRNTDHTVLVPAADKPPFRMTAYAARYQAVYQVDPEGVHRLDPKNYCADQAVCRAARPSCGTVRTASGKAVVRLVRGTTTCKEALRITDRYYNDGSIAKQGSGGHAVVDGWACGSTTVADQEVTGHYGSCTRGTTMLSMDAT